MPSAQLHVPQCTWVWEIKKLEEQFHEK
jgi:hypothetical protein